MQEDLETLRKNMNLNGIFSSLNIDNKNITSTNSYNYLGLTIDENHTFRNHIKNVIRSISPFVGILKKIRYYVNNNCLMSIYYAHIHSRLTYLLPIWSSTSNCHLKIIKYMQNKVFRNIQYKPWDYSTKQLYTEKLLSFNQTINFETILLIHKLKNNLIRNSINVEENINTTNRITRRAKNVRLPQFFTKSAQNNMLFRGFKLYNELPYQLKQQSLDSFKMSLRTYVFNKYPIG
jgi:hypothetical protein